MVATSEIIDLAEYDEHKVSQVDPEGDDWEQYLTEQWRKVRIPQLGVDEKDDLPW
jgi:hypothetical protein